MNIHNAIRKKKDPINTILDDFSEIINPHLHSIGVTANTLLSISLFFSIITAILIHYNLFEFAALSFAIGYIFDSMNSNMVRMFNDSKPSYSVYLIQLVLLIVFIAINQTLSYDFKVIFFMGLIIFLGLMMVHIGCQEKQNEKKSANYLSQVRVLCPNKEMIQYTRYFGEGANNLKIAILLLFARNL